MPLEPAVAQVLHHAHGHDGLDVAQLALQVAAGLGLRLGGGFAGGHGAAVAQPDHDTLDQREADGGPAQYRVQQEQHDDVDRHPGGIEEREHALPREELAQVHEVAKRAAGLAAGLLQVRGEAGVEHARAEDFVELLAREHQHARAQPFGAGQHQEQEQGDQRHGEQGQLAAADHDPVEHLQHIQRGRKHQHIGHHAQQRHEHELAPEQPQGPRQLAALEKGRSTHQRDLSK